MNLFILHRQAIRFAVKRLFSQPVGTLLILLMLGIALTLPLTLYLSVQSSRALVGHLTAAPQITLYLDRAADGLDREQIAAALKNDERIENFRFIPKDEALQDLQYSLGSANVVSALDENPLPDAFAVTPKAHNPEAVEALQGDLSVLPMADSAQVDADWMRTLYRIEYFLKQVLWFLAFTLGLAFLLVLGNTVRLQTFAARDEIEISRLLGAPSSFIRRPFVYLALWQGLLAMCIGLALCAWLILRIAPQFSDILQPYGIVLQWRFFNAGELCVIIALVAFLSVAAAWLAVHRHLREYASA